MSSRKSPVDQNEQNETVCFYIISLPICQVDFLFYFKDSFNEKQSIINTALCCSRLRVFLKKLKTTTADFMADGLQHVYSVTPGEKVSGRHFLQPAAGGCRLHAFFRTGR
ncbi:MAG: hypothetical protein ACI4NN_06100 [Pyramidobacter sp.]